MEEEKCKITAEDSQPGVSSRIHLGGPVVSLDIINEEEKLQRESAEAENEPDTEVTYTQDKDERRFDCFTKLLTRSEAYTNYLTHRLKTQANLRRFERARKYSLMRAFKYIYIKKGIDCEQYLQDKKPSQDDVDERDPQSILEGDMLNVIGDVVPLCQPFTLVKCKLRPYQADGVHWLKVLYENSVNGILADEMGLGKTIQCISTIAHILEMGIVGPYLIVAPLSTLPNWINEFKRFAPLIPILLYHGSQEKRSELRKNIKPVKFLDLETLPVFLTSYEIVIRDHNFLEKFSWKFLAIDEGHRIKNLNCRLVRLLKRLNSSYRLLLTGTPLQNNLSELWSLMNFLLPEVFGDLESFHQWFDPEELLDTEKLGEAAVEEQKQQILSTLHRILQPFILRRVKSDVEIDLPPKKEILVYAPLTNLQQKYYTSTLDKSIRSIFELEEEEEIDMLPAAKKPKLDESCSSRCDSNSPKASNDGSEVKERRSSMRLKRKSVPKSRPRNDAFVGDTDIKLTNPTMQLRKIVNHPYLIHYPFDPRTEQYIIDEELVSNCGKLLVMDAILKKLKQRGHKVLIFSQMTILMDILEDYMNLRNFSYVRLDGRKDVDERLGAIKEFQEEDIFVFLLSTRAGGLGINLTAADTVIIYDSDWNPQCDLQAMDRCHRIGQSKPVIVYRLVTAATIDEHIVKRATAKRKLEKMIMQTGKFKEKKGRIKGISIQELRDLLAANDYDIKMHPNGLVFSDEELASLVDRDLLFQLSNTGISNEPSTSKDTRSCFNNNLHARDINKLFKVL